ncbi:MAG: IclR family transcriptional regulator [Actinomycetia bacterium]|nr:IclR family transcriptional regulator [Actinomycetes bacterium]
MVNDTKGQTITAVERTAEVLKAFARTTGSTLGVTEIAQELDISKAVVHRILNSLRVQGFIEVVPTSRRYTLGPSALAVGLAFLRNVDVRELARPVLRELSDATSETATLSIRSGWQRMYIDQVTPAREVKMTVDLGRPFPLHAGSSSKVLLAHLSSEEIDTYISSVGLRSLTDLTITDSEHLHEELAAIREAGFATSSGERQSGAASVAAPILDHDGHPIAAMSLCGPAERFLPEADDAAKSVMAACTTLSQQMGYRV